MPDDSAQRPEDARADGPATPEPGGEPTRFRVADTGWPPPSGSVGPALPRRTPGASGGPAGGPAAADEPPEEPPPAEPEAVRSGWVTSPPLDDEPWAGLPPTAADTDQAEPPVVPVGAPMGAPVEEAPMGEPVEEAEPDVEPAAARTSGRHRGARGRHGRPRGRGRRRPATATVPDPADPTTGPRPAWPVVRLGLLALAVVGALVFGMLNVVARVWPGPAANPYTSSSTRAAIAAATAVAAPILSYDYRTIDKKAAQLAPLQTATCAAQYQKLLTSTVKPLAVQNKATQQAAVLAAGVTSATKSTATILVFMQLTSSNSVKTGKAINEAQISVSMVQQHGRWLLAGTSANGAGSGGTPSCGGANPTGG